ncbi:MAG: hypothetical protein WED01_06205 [Candidatus Rokuibacteriota bacterium]
MTVRSLVAFLMVAAAVSVPMPARGQALEVYDAFGAGELDPVRWRGYEYTVEGTSSRTVALFGGYNDVPRYRGESFYGPSSVGESRRGVLNRRAQITLTSSKRGGFQGTTSHGRARAGLRMNHPGLADSAVVTTLRASVTVAGVSAEPPDPVTESCGWYNSARAQVFGHFFNDGSSTGPGDLTGDVFASVSLERRVEETSAGPAVRDVVEARVGRCNTPECRMTWDAILFTRTWTVGAAHVLTITWQPGSDRFKFTVSGGGIAAESRTVAYAVADSAPPRGYAYDLRVESQPGFCGAGQELIWQTVSIDARFDNVKLNSAAASAAR